ncbi:MAG TPA: hypothetical protein VFN38_03625, partial [Gemmatimonadaceae bacterium]|nr:hypothetical protein [Gemmatimonadaceae bacterium]
MTEPSSIRAFLLCALLLPGLGCARSAALETVPEPSPAALERGIATADSLIQDAVGKQFPGAVFLVARDGKVLHERAFGWAQLYDSAMRRLADPPVM